MRLFAAAIKELIALGVKGDALMKAIDRLEAATQEAGARSLPEAVDASAEIEDAKLPDYDPAERRRRLDRERKRKSAENSAPVAENSANEDGSALSLPSSPQTPQQPTHTRKELSTRARKTLRRCPADWLPSPKTFLTLNDEGFAAGEIERALTRMRDHEFRTARTDWDATFRNWVRGDKDRSPRKANERPHTDPKQQAREDNLARAWRGSESAAGREDWIP